MQKNKSTIFRMQSLYEIRKKRNIWYTDVNDVIFLKIIQFPTRLGRLLMSYLKINRKPITKFTLVWPSSLEE